MSVFHISYFLSYIISSEDNLNFHFQLKSTSKDATYAPDNFSVKLDNKKWIFLPPLDKKFQQSTISTLKKIIK